MFYNTKKQQILKSYFYLYKHHHSCVWDGLLVQCVQTVPGPQGPQASLATVEAVNAAAAAPNASSKMQSFFLMANERGKSW